MKGANHPNLHLRNGIWHCDFVDPAGRQIRRSLKTRDEKLAKMMVSKMMKDAYEKGNFDMKKPAKMKFKELAKEVLEYANGRKKCYVKVYVPIMKHLVEYFGEKYLGEIDLRLINKYQTSRKGEVADITVNKEIEMIRICFNHAIKMKYIYSNPVVGVQYYKIPERKFRFLDEGEIATLLANSTGYIRDIILVAIYTGARKSEILNLTWDRVDFNNRLVIYDKTKNNKIREIPMSSEIEAMLSKRRAADPKGIYVFPGEVGKPIGAMYKSFWSVLDKAEIKECRFHDLRHTFASHLVMAGVNILSVKELLGHSELSTTMIYAHLAPNHNRGAISALESRLGKVVGLQHVYSTKAV